MVISDEQLKNILLKTGIVEEKKLYELIDFARVSNLSLSEVLVERDIITDQNLGMVIADYLKIPFVVLSNTPIPEELTHIIPERIARKYKIVAFGMAPEGLKVAMVDPNHTEVISMIARKAGFRIMIYLATERDLENALHMYKRNLQKSFDALIKEQINRTDYALNDAPVIKIVDLLINYAYQDKASDIHIEPQENNSLVRFRIDGILHDVLFLPKGLHDRIITRIKVLSRLRTDEHLAAQDGKMQAKLPEELLDIRVSILPIVEGEKAVLRLLSSKNRHLSLLDLGMNEKDLKKVTNGFKKSYGMILSTGPTGSGKTSSIYSIVKILNTREKNITTIEDPVEYRIKGVNQIQVNPKTDLTFAQGLRSILRQDPNVVFVGEIRDPETAGIAVNAALTGHLVLSTLHTNDAATALPRLVDMKVEPFLVASTVNIIFGQRLVRKICEICKRSSVISRSELTKQIPEEIVRKNFGDRAEVRVYQGAGCKVCHKTGYLGRIGVFEVLEMDKEIKDLIAAKHDSDEIAKIAIQKGMTTMLDDGFDKVLKGITTIEEVLRVTKVESL